MPAIKGKTMTNNADLKKRNFLTQNEIESLLKAADTGPYAARNYCLTLLCFIHGLRASEICRLRISDIDLAARCVYIHRLKKGFSTTHPLLDKEIYALKRWLAIRSSWPQAPANGCFSPAKVIPFPANSFIRLSRPQGDWQGCHWRSTRTCCGTPVALRWRIWGSIPA